MDSITQAALGASIGEAVLGKEIGYKGAVMGAAIATLPDLDVILYGIYSRFEMLSIHRGFSHSIVFSVIVAVLAAWIISRIRWGRGLSFVRLLLFSWLCLITHMILDAFTAYGTQLFLPFSNARMGLDSINVVDPVYTIPLILGLVGSLAVHTSHPKRQFFNGLGMLLSTLYLLFTLVNKSHIESYYKDSFEKEGVPYQKLLTMPVGMANINWYGVAKSRDSLFMQKHSLLSEEEEGIESFPIHDEYLNRLSSEQAEVMRWFAKGFYTVERIGDTVRIFNLQVDMRGVVDLGGRKAPTVGYFEFYPENGEMSFSSGSLNDH